jgi:hypothetical protein
VRAIAMITWAVLMLACRAPDDDVAQARALTSAYEAFQRASLSERPSALASLRAVKASDPQVIAARDVCATYAAALTRQGELSAKAREYAPEDSGGNGALTPEGRTRVIRAAEEALEEAEAAQPKCKEALSPLWARVLRR